MSESVPEMTCPREDHRDAVLVGGCDRLFVAHASTGLHDGGDTRMGEFVDGVTLRQMLNSGPRILPERGLEVIAGVLLDAELCGYPALGLARAITIAEDERTRAPRKPVAIVHETPVSAQLDGGGLVSSELLLGEFYSALLAKERGVADDPRIRQRLADCYAKVQIMRWNGMRVLTQFLGGHHPGPDAAIVGNVASELAIQMKRIPIIANVISETALDRPELRIQPRADLAARLGVSTEGLSETIRVATIGDVGPALAKFDAGDRLVPIRVQLEDSARGELATLEQLQVPIYGGRGAVPLSVVADAVSTPYAAITRTGLEAGDLAVWIGAGPANRRSSTTRSASLAANAPARASKRGVA